MNDITTTATQLKTPRLVGIKPLIKELFPDETTAPSERSVWDWKAKGVIPFVQISNRVFFDPDKVRAALDAQFGHSPSV